MVKKYCFLNLGILWDCSKRALLSAWKAGCILWVLNNKTWTKAMADVVEWLVYHDIWSKMQIFADLLKEGDTFAFHVLDDTYTYRIDQIRTVLPTEMRDLDFDPNQDYATLITCTPYGVNSHRLLVRGHRIPTPAETDETQYDKADTNRTLVIAGIALAIVLFILWIIWLIVRRSRKRGRNAVSGTQVKHAGR